MNKGSLDTKKKGLIGLGALVVLAGATILGSDPLYKAIDDMARPAIYTAGTYTASARGYGGPVTVTVKVSTKAIESIDVVGERDTFGSGSTFPSGCNYRQADAGYGCGFRRHTQQRTQL